MYYNLHQYETIDDSDDGCVLRFNVEDVSMTVLQPCFTKSIFNASEQERYKYALLLQLSYRLVSQA